MSGPVLRRRHGADDPIHQWLRFALEKPERAHLWTPADAITFTPGLLSVIYGDGRALFTLATINQRPAYWVIRGCSTWGCGLDREDGDGPEFGELTDEILTDLEEYFGRGRCGYSGNSLFWPREERIEYCDCEECDGPEVSAWPEVDDYCGCSWSRCDWPPGFPAVANPLSRRGNLIDLPAPTEHPRPAAEKEE